MSDRGRSTTPCTACRNTGKAFAGYAADGSIRSTGERCRECDGVGAVPTLHGRIITWKTAFNLLDRDKENAAPAAQPDTQATFINGG